MTITTSPRCLLIHGPTASGKSALALTLAEKLNGEIINGDSMQVYDHLRVLTARPPDEDLLKIPHHLDGVLTGDHIGSVGWWYETACALIQQINDRGKLPIVVGGTGMYLKTITHGLAQIPDISPDIRAKARSLAQTDDFYQTVIEVDPLIAPLLHPSDHQRLTRALEVMWETGLSITHWQKQSLFHLSPRCYTIALMPERSTLYQRINNRFVTMMDTNAVDEVAHLLSSRTRVDSPIFKAVGAPEIAAYIKGTLNKEDATLKAQQATRNYAKRQNTWLRHQLTPDITLEDIYNKNIYSMLKRISI